MAKKSQEVPVLLGLERVEHHLSGTVQARSDPQRVYQPFITLEATMLCPCTGSTARDSICAHLVELVANLSAEELREWILSAQVIPQEISADVDANAD